MKYKADSQDWSDIDIITHFKFCATMQLRTPYCVLDRHNETYWDRTAPPPIFFREAWQGIWVPQTNLSDRMASGSMMASEIGPIPAHGGDFLRFLLEIRYLAENTSGPERRVTAIENECRRDIWAAFVAKLGGPSMVGSRFYDRVKKK
ncbi:hypothetical protein [Pseudomonas brassicacearum]|uniref:hypothetical protein n=1 Tax=Pseudomonas brassicacearum TaxID=930166 RepID=UPI0012BBF801|nr:hypothetical protein [Pseudomonas brassicacearum]